MKDQLHIRNAEAAQLARALARQTGKTITEIVLDALRQYRCAQGQPSPPGRIKQWRRLLRRDKGRLIRSEVPIEAFYNRDTGLPE
ncbi:MAG: type II toxin-antitoxin system VapB family antitoxin [Alphaproteobacteria bacterium]|nr:type II toxin-antitoxin system VapB family antitoxin [Alphaproteobacteria bacterium]